jgi:hypothetical protein
VSARGWAVWTFGLLFALSAAAPAALAADEASAFRESGYKALTEGRAGDAIADFEALADRGVVDPTVSFDRGLAYAQRARAGGEFPGDLGRAAHGFEEARALTTDANLAREAEGALALVRSEVARRSAHAGEPVDLDQGRSLVRAIAHLFGENVWAVLALAASLAWGVGLFLRTFADASRVRIAGAVTSGLAVFVLVGSGGMTLLLRHERLSLREGVVVAPSARPADERGIAIPGAKQVPEAARVEIDETKPGWVHVRWGSTQGWVPSTTVRPIAKAL